MTAENRSWVVTRLQVVPRWIQSTVERLARTSLGQTVLAHLDRFLWVVEKSAEWSLPRNETYPAEDISREDNEGSTERTEHVRPLPWILFLPSLMMLRLIRMGLNAGTFILGCPRIEPIAMVRFVQRNRKRLRCLKSSNGSPRTKFKNKPQDKRLSMSETKRALIRSIRLTLSTLSCLDGSKPSLSPPPTKIHVSALDLDVTSTPQERSPTESAESLKPIAERKHSVETISSECSDDSADETLQEKIDRLALESSTGDPDFFPAASSTFSSDEHDYKDDYEDDLNISQNELQDITEDSKMHETLLYVPNDESQQKQDSREQKTSAKEDNDKAECDLSPHSSDSREFRTPSRLSQDAETPFYSPTSSDTETQESTISPNSAKSSRQTDVPRTNECANGEVHFASESTTSDRPLADETNDDTAEKRGNTSANKHQQRGKRTSHGSRRRK